MPRLALPCWRLPDDAQPFILTFCSTSACPLVVHLDLIAPFCTLTCQAQEASAIHQPCMAQACPHLQADPAWLPMPSSGGGTSTIVAASGSPALAGDTLVTSQGPSTDCSLLNQLQLDRGRYGVLSVATAGRCRWRGGNIHRHHLLR